MIRQEAKQSMRLIYRHAMELLQRDYDFAQRKYISARDEVQKHLFQIEMSEYERKLFKIADRCHLVN
jgi:hypothetical protein